MADQPQQTNLDEHRYYPDDEIELMDYLLMIWKWKYLIITGTLAFAIVAALISFTTWKQQPNIYRTNIVLKPGILKIDEGGKPVLVDSPGNIKALIEGDLKYNVLDYIKSSNVPNLSHSAEFKIDIPQGSNMINVSLESTEADQDKTKLNYLIKTLLAEFANKIKYIQAGYDKKIKEIKTGIEAFKAEEDTIKKDIGDQIERKKTLLAELKEKESIARINFEKIIQAQKNIIADMLFEENKLKNEIDNYEQKLLDIESNLKILRGRIDLSSNKKDVLDNLAIQNAYNNASKSYYMENENAKYNLFKLKRKILEVSNHIKDLEKSNDSVPADPILQPEMHKIQKDTLNVSKEIKDLEKAKDSVTADPILQPEMHKIQKDIINILKEIKDLKKANDSVQADPILQTELYKIQKDIINVKRLLEIQKNVATISKEIEKLEKEKLNIQNIRVAKPPITTEIPKKNKIKLSVALSLVVGLFLMIFLAFFLEYLSNYKSKRKASN